MKLGKNIKVCFSGKTYKGEIPDRIAKHLGLDQAALDGMQKKYDEKEKKASADSKKAADTYSAKLQKRIQEKSKKEAADKAELAASKQPVAKQTKEEPTKKKESK